MGLLIETILDLEIGYEDTWKGKRERKEVVVAVRWQQQLAVGNDLSN